MGTLIRVVSSTGVSKTALVRALCKLGLFVAGLEEHYARPLENIFKTDHRYTHANKLDYLLLRAEQARFTWQSLKNHFYK